MESFPGIVCRKILRFLHFVDDLGLSDLQLGSVFHALLFLLASCGFLEVRCISNSVGQIVYTPAGVWPGV